jgi:hypothetical protein
MGWKIYDGVALMVNGVAHLCLDGDPIFLQMFEIYERLTRLKEILG